MRLAARKSGRRVLSSPPVRRKRRPAGLRMIDPSPPPADVPPIPLARPLLAAAAASRPAFGSDLCVTEISRRDAWLDVLLLLIVPIGMIYVPTMIMWASPPEGETPEIRRFDYVVAGIKWAEFMLVAFLATYFVLRHGVRMRSLGIRFDGLGRQLLWAVATFVGAYAYLVLTALIAIPLLYYFAGDEIQHDLANRQKLMQAVPDQDLMLVITLLIAVGFHEELLFRGLLLTHLRRATGRWWMAVLGSSLVFGALHFVQGWLAVIQITGLAIVLCMFFLASRSVLAVSLAHFGFDLCQFQMMQLIKRMMEWLHEHGYDVPAGPI
jgi:membrane protease YdiL (CAAX protease family)